MPLSLLPRFLPFLARSRATSLPLPLLFFLILLLSLSFRESRRDGLPSSFFLPVHEVPPENDSPFSDFSPLRRPAPEEMRFFFGLSAPPPGHCTSFNTSRLKSPASSVKCTPSPSASPSVQSSTTSSAWRYPSDTRRRDRKIPFPLAVRSQITYSPNNPTLLEENGTWPSYRRILSLRTLGQAPTLVPVSAELPSESPPPFYTSPYRCLSHSTPLDLEEAVGRELPP